MNSAEKNQVYFVPKYRAARKAGENEKRTSPYIYLSSNKEEEKEASQAVLSGLGLFPDLEPTKRRNTHTEITIPRIT